jgi:hypothetical protein
MSGKKMSVLKKYLCDDAEIKKKLKCERQLIAKKIRRREHGRAQDVKVKTVFLCQTSKGQPYNFGVSKNDSNTVKGSTGKTKSSRGSAKYGCMSLGQKTNRPDGH